MTKPRLVLTLLDNGMLGAEYEWHVYRFLLASGRMVDVVAIRCDSDLRAAVLKFTKEERIEGSAILPLPDESEDEQTEPGEGEPRGDEQ
jgi:hypothetical protein